MRNDAEVLKTSPWLDNPKWASGKIADTSGVAVAFFWVFAIVWNALSWPVAIAIVPTLAKRWAALGVMIFPAVGVLLLSNAVYVTFRRRKFGRSTLELETLPGVPGGWLAGIIHVPTSLRDAQHIRLTLTCIQHVRDSDGDSTRRILWQDEQFLRAPPGIGGAGSTDIPVSFRIPAECHASDDSSARNAFSWNLEAHAPLSGTDYSAEFVVPVFQATQEAALIPRAESAAAKLRLAAGDDTFDLKSDAAGRVQLRLGAGRNIGAGMFIGTFGLGFTAAAVAMTRFDDMASAIIFPGAFGVVGVLLLISAANLLFKLRTVLINQDSVQATWRLLGLRGTSVMPRDSIEKVSYDSTMSTGGKRYFNIRVIAADGRKIILASGLLVSDARRLAEQLAHTLNVEAEEEFARPIVK